MWTARSLTLCEQPKRQRGNSTSRMSLVRSAQTEGGGMPSGELNYRRASLKPLRRPTRCACEAPPRTAGSLDSFKACVNTSHWPQRMLPNQRRPISFLSLTNKLLVWRPRPESNRLARICSPHDPLPFQWPDFKAASNRQPERQQVSRMFQKPIRRPLARFSGRPR
jgi:hypothetical protein